jgi:hypothetical protein
VARSLLRTLHRDGYFVVAGIVTTLFGVATIFGMLAFPHDGWTAIVMLLPVGAVVFQLDWMCAVAIWKAERERRTQ